MNGEKFIGWALEYNKKKSTLGEFCQTFLEKPYRQE